MSLLMSARSGGTELVFIFIVVFIVVMILIAQSAERNQMRKTLELLAGRVGGTLNSEGVFLQPSVSFELHGRPARCEVKQSAKNSPSYSRISVDLQGRAPGTLHIVPDGFSQSFLRMFGAQDLEIGDPSFDAQYVIKAFPESNARLVFGGERQLQAIRAVRQLSTFRDPVIDLAANQLTVRVRDYETDVNRLLLLVDTAETFVKFLAGPAAATGIQMEEVRILSGGECPVCSTPMRDQIVRCEACRTPHHRECWDYMGRCSTYACRGTRAAA